MSGASALDCPFDPVVNFYACKSQPGVYGTLGVPAAANTPAGGSGFSSWTDKDGNFWLFGGQTSDVTGQMDGFYQGEINEIWAFNPSLNAWAWMGGDYATSNCYWFVSVFVVPFCNGPQGVNGSLGIAAIGNTPSSRTGAVTWTDKNGALWLFSGQVAVNSSGESNDLWRFQPSLSTLPAAATPIFSLQPGTYIGAVPITIANGMPKASIHYTTDGTAPTASSTLYSGVINLSASASIQAIATAPGYRSSAIASSAYTIVSPPEKPTFSVASGTYTTVQTVAISDSTPGATIFYTTDGTPVNGNSPVYSAPVTVSSSETIQASAAIPGSGNVVFNGITFPGGGVRVSSVASASYVINLPAAAGDFGLTASPASLTLKTGQSGSASIIVTPLNGFNAEVKFGCSGLPAGASCSFSPATVTPATGPASTTLTVRTSAAALLRANGSRFGGLIPAFAFCWFCWKKGRRFNWLAVMGFASAGLYVLTACGGGSSLASSPPPVVATITVTASSGVLTHTTTLTLTIE
jgi:hypothetical protein